MPPRWASCRAPSERQANPQATTHNHRSTYPSPKPPITKTNLNDQQPRPRSTTAINAPLRPDMLRRRARHAYEVALRHRAGSGEWENPARGRAKSIPGLPVVTPCWLKRAGPMRLLLLLLLLCVGGVVVVQWLALCCGLCCVLCCGLCVVCVRMVVVPVVV